MAKDCSITRGQASLKLGVSKTTLRRFLTEENIKWNYSHRKNKYDNRCQDNEDRLIIELIILNKKTTRELANILNISQPAVIYKINKLKKQGKFDI